MWASHPLPDGAEDVGDEVGVIHEAVGEALDAHEPGGVLVDAGGGGEDAHALRRPSREGLDVSLPHGARLGPREALEGLAVGHAASVGILPCAGPAARGVGGGSGALSEGHGAAGPGHVPVELEAAADDEIGGDRLGLGGRLARAEGLADDALDDIVIDAEVDEGEPVGRGVAGDDVQQSSGVRLRLARGHVDRPSLRGRGLWRRPRRPRYHGR
ncbi:MAG: hypothetical protein ACOX6M_04520 [Armatimonadota bacterium]